MKLRASKFISVLAMLGLVIMLVCGPATESFAVSQAVWGENGLNDRQLGKYCGKSYDYTIPGEKYNHCVGYAHWALTHFYGDQFEDMPDCIYVRLMRNWVIRKCNARKIRLVGGATIRMQSGTILKSEDLDLQPGDIVFFHTAMDRDAKMHLSAERILRQVAESRKTQWPGSKKSSQKWEYFCWQHVAIVGGDGKTLYESTNGKNGGIIHRRTPDGVLRQSRKKYWKHRKTYWERRSYRQRNFTYQVWRPTADPKDRGE